MCGIAGSMDASATDGRSVVERQLRTLDHRGPDASGVFTGRGAAIGQNRLAIIDLVSGDPPIANEDGTVGVVLNGEIYNYRELREGLLREGHELSSEGDTEVIAHLAESEEPVDLARRLEGMFAFAVWDDRRRRLVLGRDRMGKKPLFYWEGGGKLVFGSEIKALLAHPGVPRELDPEAIPAYLTFGYVPTPRTFYAGIRSLSPGHVLVAEDGRVTIERYWAPTVGASNGGGPPTPAELRAGLRAAVDRRLISDVPVGAFLSGGVDSSCVVGLMAEASEEPVRTFTIGFEDSEGFDERPYARLVADRFATDHTEFVVAPEAVDLVERLVWHHDQPFGDSSAIPTFMLSELTRGHVTVALCGDGGDELFAGYPRFNAGVAIERFGSVLGSRPVSAVAGVGSWPGVGASVQRALRRASLGMPDAFMTWVSIFDAERRRALTGAGESWATEDYRSIWRESAGADPLERVLDLNLRTYLLDDLLVKVDRVSMAHGLEVRSPFLDRELLELAQRVPARGHAGLVSRKRALRAAIGDLLPREILRRGKRGFGVPLDRWFRTDLRSFVESRLGSAGARVREHVAGAPVDALLAEHQSGRGNHGHGLWTLLTLEVFLQREAW